jgi:DNA-binding MurR/RpiR family transcriptional regulator
MFTHEHQQKPTMKNCDILEKLKNDFPSYTPTGKKIASYMLANLHQVPFESALSIARLTGTTGVSVGRFLRQIGFQNLEELKQSFRIDAGRPWMQTDRLESFRLRKGQQNPLQRSLALEVDAIQDAYRLATTPEFAQIADRVAHAEAVFIAGIQAYRGHANTFFSQLEYIRPRVYFADGASGAYVESLNSEYASPYLIISDFRAYSSMTRRYCEAAQKRNLKLLLITDLYCTWARDYSIDLLQLKTEVQQYWDALSPLSCLYNLLLSAVVERLGPNLDNRLSLNKELQRELGQFEI